LNFIKLQFKQPFNIKAAQFNMMTSGLDYSGLILKNNGTAIEHFHYLKHTTS